MRDWQAAAQARASHLGVSVGDAQWQALDAFWRLLLLWNARINLTGASTVEQLVGEHLPDSLAMARLVPAGAHVLDVGSGGGLPAIPFGLLRPDARLTLVEPRAKRSAFLRTAVRESGLAADVLVGRIEDVAARPADVACSRATFGPGEWLERARGLAPRALVFCARPQDAVAPLGPTLEQELAYETEAGHARWLGLYRST